MSWRPPPRPGAVPRMRATAGASPSACEAEAKWRPSQFPLVLSEAGARSTGSRTGLCVDVFVLLPRGCPPEENFDYPYRDRSDKMWAYSTATRQCLGAGLLLRTTHGGTWVLGYMGTWSSQSRPRPAGRVRGAGQGQDWLDWDEATRHWPPPPGRLRRRDIRNTDA